MAITTHVAGKLGLVGHTVSLDILVVGNAFDHYFVEDRPCCLVDHIDLVLDLRHHHIRLEAKMDEIHWFVDMLDLVDVQQMNCQHLELALLELLHVVSHRQLFSHCLPPSFELSIPFGFP